MTLYPVDCYNSDRCEKQKESYTRIIGTVLGIVIPAAIVLGLISSLYKQFARFR